VACDASPDAPELGAPAAGPEVRPDTPGNNLQFSFERGDTVESFASVGGRFRVHFTRSGPNAVPAADANTDGVPDFVEEVAAVYDEVLAFYTVDLGFRAPLDDGDIADNGGDDRFDVYLVDFAGVGDGNFAQDQCSGGTCAGFMTQENDYAGYGYPSTLYANRILGSHELFHAVQAAYDVDQGSVLAEGTAVWATERYDPTLEDFEHFIDGYLENPDRPIDEGLPGPADPFSYGAAIFFQYLEEAHGPNMVRALWEASEDGANGVADPYWVEALGPALEATAGVTFANAFAEFARWNLFTDDFADPGQAYAAGDGYPRVRIDPATAPHQDDALRVYYASAQYYGLDPAGRAAIAAALVPTATAPDATTDLRLFIATESGGARSVTSIADVSAGTETVDASNASRVIVVVVNVASGGDSKKPGLCIGAPDEVAACKVALGEVGGGGGGSGPGGGGPGDDDGGDDADGDDAGDGCGCVEAGRTPAQSSWAAVAFSAAIAAYGRRRRAKNKRPSAT